MKRRLRKFASALLAVIIGVSVLVISPITTSALTQNDVVSWMNSKNGTTIYDGGSQCVAAFNSYLRTWGISNPISKYPVNYAYQIFNYNAPEGWQKISGSGNYQVGDVVIWNSSVGGGCGHVGMVYSTSGGTVKIFDQNYVAKNVCGIHNIAQTSAIRGVFRPPFSNPNPPEPEALTAGTILNLGNSFSARIRNISMDKVITYSGGNAVIGTSMNNKIARQIWNFSRNNNGSYTIKTCLNDTCMELHNFNNFDGGNVTCIPANGSTAQNWFIYQRSDGSCYLRPECSSSRVLDITGGNSYDGNNAELWTYNNTDAQRFSIDKCGSVINLGEDFVASIEHTEYWKPLTQNYDNNVVLFTSSQENMSRILWHFERDIDNGWYTITSYENGKRLEVANEEDKDGANVQCGDPQDTYAQYWYVLRGWDENGQEYNYIKSACSSKNLDLYDNSEKDGANIQMWSINSSSAQKFSVYKINGDTSYSITTEKEAITLGQSANIFIKNTTFVINYKFHIVDPSGIETVIDNKCNYTYNFIPQKVGRYLIFCEVNSPVSSYTGSISDNYVEINVSNNIQNINSEGFGISLSSSSYTYDGTAKTPTVTVKNDTATLAKDTDYTVEYSNNINAGTSTITVTGIGNYTGTLTKTFTINKASQILNATIDSNTVDVGGTSKITASGQGTISYSSSNNDVATVSSLGVVTGISAGTATITVTAAGNSNYNSASKTISVAVEKSCLSGDVNSDGKITIDDVTLVQKYLASVSDFTTSQKDIADVNNDGDISIDDVTLMQKYIAGIITKLG